MKQTLLLMLLVSLTSCGGEEQPSIEWDIDPVTFGPTIKRADHDAVTVDLIEVGDETPRRHKLEALAEMHRLGYNEWVVKCAYAHAHDGEAVEVAIENCSADFDV